MNEDVSIFPKWTQKLITLFIGAIQLLNHLKKTC